MKNKMISFPLSLLLLLSNQASAFESLSSCMPFTAISWIEEHFTDFRNAFNDSVDVQYEQYLYGDWSDTELDEDVGEIEDDENGLAYGQTAEDLTDQLEYTPAYLNAEHIESTEEITVIADADGDEVELHGYFCDFDGSNGYMVITDDYKIYGLETEGDNPFMDVLEFDELLFYEVSGYAYRCLGEIYSVADLSNYCMSFSAYKGQASRGCGRIYYADMYIRNRYGVSYQRTEMIWLSMYRFTQYNLSVYHHYDEDEAEWLSEDNCWIVSGFHVLQYLSDNRELNNAPVNGDTIYYSAGLNEPNIMSKYFDEDGNCKEFIYINGKKTAKYRFNPDGTRKFPSLYADFRRYANDNYQKCDIGVINETGKMMVGVAKKYKTKLSYSTHKDWKLYLGDAMAQLSNDSPLIWVTNGCKYGNHMMAVCGYRKYQAEEELNVEGITYTSKSTKLLFGLRDGWSSYYDDDSQKTYTYFYFDMSAHNQENSTLTSFKY